MKAVRFDTYGGIDVLRVADVPVPEPGPGHVLVKVKAASINPGEAKIFEGLLDAIFPATFPSGEGSGRSRPSVPVTACSSSPARITGTARRRIAS